MAWIGKCFKVLGRHIRTTLIAGLLVVIPLVVTVVILKFAFEFFDTLLKPLYDQFSDVFRPGMGVAALVLVIYAAGLVTTQLLGRRFIELGHNLVGRIPVVSGVYRAARQATELFSKVSTDSKYGGVVLVDFPGNGLRSIGLVTGRLKDRDGNPLIAVYVPTSPFPTSGFLLILPDGQVTPTDLPVEDAMKIIVSAGIVVPERIVTNPDTFEGGPFPTGSSPFQPEGQGAQPHAPNDNRASNQ